MRSHRVSWIGGGADTCFTAGVNDEIGLKQIDKGQCEEERYNKMCYCIVGELLGSAREVDASGVFVDEENRVGVEPYATYLRFPGVVVLEAVAAGCASVWGPRLRVTWSTLIRKRPDSPNPVQEPKNWVQL